MSPNLGSKKSVRFCDSDFKFTPIKARCKPKNGYYTRKDLSPGRTLKRGENVFDRNTFPMPSAVALQFYKRQLSLYERAEILEYSKVYFLGVDIEKPKDCYFTSQDGHYGYVQGD